MESLCAGLNRFQPTFDGKLDSLIVTGLEMQAGNIDVGAPVAAEQRVFTDEIQRPADDPALQLGQDQKYAVGHGLVELVEHAFGQIGAAPFAVDGRQVEAVEMVDMFGCDVFAGQPQQADTGFLDGTAFLADVLALARRQRGKEPVEIGIAVILPVELDRRTDHPAKVGQWGGIALGQEINMRRRQFEPLQILHHSVCKRGAKLRGAVRRSITDEESRAGRRGEGHRRQHFRIIGPAGAGEGVRPAVVEDIFAVRMMFQIMRHRGGEPSFGIT